MPGPYAGPGWTTPDGPDERRTGELSQWSGQELSQSLSASRGKRWMRVRDETRVGPDAPHALQRLPLPQG